VKYFGPGKMSPFTNSPLTLKFPPVSGCYIISYKGRVLYVGQSMNIHKRWTMHHHRVFLETAFPDATVEIILCGDDRIQKEKELIETLKPLMNGRAIWRPAHRDRLIVEWGICD
jgi:excinuclease UvrABC nuclease subunit